MKALPTIPWKRYWCPLGQPINCGDFGRDFLADPEGALGGIWSPNTFELDQILDRSCLILVGEPGMGKTKAIECARQMIASRPGSDSDPLWLAFRDLPNEQVFHRRTVETPKWQKWLQSDRKLTLVIDGVDEGLIRVPGFIAYLTSELRGLPLDRLQLILVCRTAEWSLAEGGQLIGLWGNSDSPSVFELCPLRHKDVLLAAKMWGVNAEAFMLAVYEQQVTGLAARPTTLFFLLREFVASGKFPGTHFDLYRDGCRRLCQEHDAARIAAFRFQTSPAQNFTTDQIRAMAAHVAALLMLSGKSSIYVGPRERAEPSDLLLEDVAQDSEALSAAQVTLCTAVFSARGQDRLGFAHQTFAECLAAQALEPLPIAQLRSVLCQRDGTAEHVVPQLAETAAWLAAGRPDFLQLLIETEPEVLMRSDVSRVQEHHKEQLVAALLDRIKREEAFDEHDLQRFYGGLRHPGLAKQLLDYIQNPELNTLLRRVAIQIAEDCKLEELFSDFLALLRSESNFTIRNHLAEALRQITPIQRATELIPLAKGEAGPDPDDTIRGCALFVLIPQIWSVSDALPFLVPPDENFYGLYTHALSEHIPRHINRHDLNALLPKLLEWGDCFDTSNRFHAIAEKAITEAVLVIDDPQIRELTVQVWRAKCREFLHFAGERESEIKTLLNGNDALRLRFVQAILNSPGTTVEDTHHLAFTPQSSDLVFPKDMGWLLDAITSAPPDRRQVWSELIHVLRRPETMAPHWDLLLSQIEAVPQLKARFAWLRAYSLDEPEALHWKKVWEEDRQRREDWQKRKQNVPSPEVLIQRDLAAIKSGKTWAWTNLCQDLTLKPGDTHYSSVEYDLTQSPGWQSADKQRRDEVTAAARQFVLKNNDGYEELRARTNFSDSGYMAVGLLRDEVRGDPDLRQAVAQNWIDAITGRFNNGEADHQEMVALAYELNSDRCVQGLIREILDDDARHGHILALYAYRRCWNPRLSHELVNLIISKKLQPSSVESSLSFLAEIDPQAAVEVVRRLLPSGVETEQSTREQTKRVICVAFAKLLKVTWSLVWPLLQKDTEFAGYALQSIAYGMNYSAKKAVLPLASEQQLAEIYLLLHQVFPPETDPPHKSGSITPRDTIRDFRSELISTLTSRGNDAACRELLRLSELIPNQRTWLRWRHWEALRTKRRKAWQPLTIQTVCSLLENPAARVVEDEYDLLTLLLESLSRFQQSLTKSSPPEAAFLWNYEGSGNKRSNFSPKDEEDLSDAIAAWFTKDVGTKSGVVIGREVQPRRGQKTDIKVEAIPAAGEKSDQRLLTVVVEVKGCWHRQVRTAIADQLVEDYLKKNGWTHGLYVVGWYMCARWDNPDKPPLCHLKSQTYEDASKEVENLAIRYSGKSGLPIVKGVCLDCRFPA